MKKALLQINLAVFLWGFTGILGKAITLSAGVLVWYRMLLTAFFMAVILSYRRQWVKIARPDLIKLTWIGVLMAVHWIAFYGSLKLSNVSIALVCMSTASVFTTVFSRLVDKSRYNFTELFLGMLAIAGMYLIYQFQKFYALGITVGIIAALLSAWFTVLNKKIAHKYPARTMVFYEMSAGCAFITLLLPLQLYYMPGEILLPKSLDWLWLVLLSLCCTVWAQSLALNSLKRLSSFTVALSVNLEPVYGILLAFAVYHENKDLHAGFYVGMALILLSVILQMARLLKPPKAPSPGYIQEKSGIE